LVMTAPGHGLMPASPPGPVTHLLRRRGLVPAHPPEPPPHRRHGQRSEGIGRGGAETGLFCWPCPAWAPARARATVRYACARRARVTRRYQPGRRRTSSRSSPTSPLARWQLSAIAPGLHGGSPQVVAHRSGAPPGPPQQGLRRVRRLPARVRGHLPAVLTLDRAQHPPHVRERLPARRRPRGPTPEPGRPCVSPVRPPPGLGNGGLALALRRGHHDRLPR
jgi:hypothetical protein